MASPSDKPNCQIKPYKYIGTDFPYKLKIVPMDPFVDMQTSLINNIMSTNDNAIWKLNLFLLKIVKEFIKTLLQKLFVIIYI